MGGELIGSKTRIDILDDIVLVSHEAGAEIDERDIRENFQILALKHPRVKRALIVNRADYRLTPAALAYVAGQETFRAIASWFPDPARLAALGPGLAEAMAGQRYFQSSDREECLAWLRAQD